MLQYVNRLNGYRMATLILYLSTCLLRTARGERRLAGPPEQKPGAAYPKQRPQRRPRLGRHGRAVL